MARAQERYGEHPLFELERGEITEEEFGRRLEEGLPAASTSTAFATPTSSACTPTRR